MDNWRRATNYLYRKNDHLLNMPLEQSKKFEQSEILDEMQRNIELLEKRISSFDNNINVRVEQQLFFPLDVNTKKILRDFINDNAGTKIATNNKVSVTNTTTETALISATVPGGTLGVDDGIRIISYCENLSNTGGHTLTVRLKYGATTVGSIAIDPAGTVALYGKIEAGIIGNGTTNSQQGFLLVTFSDDTTTASAAEEFIWAKPASAMTATEDSTLALTLQLTVEWSSASSSDTIDSMLSTMERII